MLRIVLSPFNGLLRCVAVALLLPACAGVRAETHAESMVDETSVPQPPPRPDVEGAIGPVVSLNPEYQGASRTKTHVIPGIFIRWGRYTVTNAGGFVTRRDDDVMRGLAADLVRSDRLRVNLALRIDRGRASNDSAALSGLENVRSTVRGRLIVTRSFDTGVSATLGTSVDLLARGGGTLVDIGLGKSFPLAPKASWSVGVGATAASRRYMQSYFGITPQQAVNTGYPEYAPASGWRDASASLGTRREFGNRWIGYAGYSRSRLLGPALDSPLTQRPSSWAVNGGVAWRF
jgi:outer membrane scaffolding protein for murein synthesis (MipA/OmpV family)